MHQVPYELTNGVKWEAKITQYCITMLRSSGMLSDRRTILFLPSINSRTLKIFSQLTAKQDVDSITNELINQITDLSLPMKIAQLKLRIWPRSRRENFSHDFRSLFDFQTIVREMKSAREVAWTRRMHKQRRCLTRKARLERNFTRGDVKLCDHKCTWSITRFTSSDNESHRDFVI